MRCRPVLTAVGWAQIDRPLLMYMQMDGTQVLVVKSETGCRAGSTPGQPARTRECQLGCVFTQTDVDDQGRPVRDEGSTT